LINPLVIDREGNLIAGERRLTAAISLGWTEIAIQYIDDLPYMERRLIELDENVRRVDLPWEDYVRSVEEIHGLKTSADPEWDMGKTAAYINVDRAWIGKMLTVAQNMDSPIVAQADKISTAINAAQRIKERKRAPILSVVDKSLEGNIVPETPAAEASPDYILNTDFITWASDYRGDPFNFLHCDFPYGVGVGDKSGQSAAKITGHYEDTPETYFNLIRTLTTSPRLIDDSAHMIFWFSMDFYSETREALTSGGWNVSPFPLIWHKTDNSGIIPDPNRGPRRTYETALFCSRGDRKIIRAVSNSMGAPTTREFHTSEKPRAVLNHFFRMVVDDNSRVLDPTCGSGNSIREALTFSPISVLGLELNPDFAAGARENVRRGSIQF
jgi:hypothetical protein